jgi:hypothetical protein
MGLDAVELVMETEDRFDTSIPNEIAERILTVGDLHRFLMNRIRFRHSGQCETAAMFYPIRRLLVANFGVARSDVRPDTSLSNLISPPGRFRFWQEVQLQLLVTLPRLRRSKMLMWNGDLFPTSVTTIGDLARTCVRSMQITQEYSAADDVPVWNELCRMIGRIAGVAPDTLRPDTHFNRDLGF